jgi:hypothetical protein
LTPGKVKRLHAVHVTPGLSSAVCEKAKKKKEITPANKNHNRKIITNLLAYLLHGAECFLRSSLVCS